jgi:hypothetical protein
MSSSCGLYQKKTVEGRLVEHEAAREKNTVERESVYRGQEQPITP